MAELKVLLAEDIAIGATTKDGLLEVIGYPTYQGDQVVAVQDQDGQVSCHNVNDLQWATLEDMQEWFRKNVDVEATLKLLDEERKSE